MQVTLKILTYCDQAPTDSQVRSFNTFPIIIGRSAACDYCLTDASKYVSSNHAVIIIEDRQLFIRDTSSNGVYHNGIVEPIGRGRSVLLADKDSLAIGDYMLSIAVDIDSESALAGTGNSTSRARQSAHSLDEAALTEHKRSGNALRANGGEKIVNDGPDRADHHNSSAAEKQSELIPSRS